MSDLDDYKRLLDKAKIEYAIQDRATNDPNESIKIWWHGCYASVYAEFDIDGNLLQLDAMS